LGRVCQIIVEQQYYHQSLNVKVMDHGQNLKMLHLETSCYMMPEREVAIATLYSRGGPVKFADYWNLSGGICARLGSFGELMRML